MGKANKISYLERLHILALNNFTHDIEKINPEKSSLLSHINTAYQQPVNAFETVSGFEKVLFRVIGEGWLLDILVDDIAHLKTAHNYISNIRASHLTKEQSYELKQLMEWPTVASPKFGKGIRDLSILVRNIILILVFVFIGGLIFLITRMMNNTIIPLEEVISVFEKISNGDLSVTVNRTTEGGVGQMQLSIISMIEALRNMVTEINQVSDSLSDSAAGSSVITTQTLQGVKAQKTETESLATSVDAMSMAINEIAISASSAATSAVTGEQAAEKGKSAVLSTVNLINDLSNEVNLSAEAIQRIESDSEKIGTVVQMIQGITEQTNLLALNAAIEAARAGEHGRGFAVVADEVRVLAHRTQSSTQEIQHMIEELCNGTRAAAVIMDRSRERAHDSVTQATQTGEVLNEVVKVVSTIMSKNKQIALAAEEQGAVTNEINKNTAAINKVADEAAVGGEQVSQASNDIVALSQQLSSIIQRFKL